MARVMPRRGPTETGAGGVRRGERRAEEQWPVARGLAGEAGVSTQELLDAGQAWRFDFAEVNAVSLTHTRHSP